MRAGEKSCVKFGGESGREPEERFPGVYEDIDSHILIIYDGYRQIANLNKEKPGWRESFFHRHPAVTVRYE